MFSIRSSRRLISSELIIEGYVTQSRDTQPEAERVLFDFYRRMTPAEKVRIMFDLVRVGDESALAEIRSRHPGCSEHEAHLRLASKKYPRDLMIRAYGWDPEIEGE